MERTDPELLSRKMVCLGIQISDRWLEDLAEEDKRIANHFLIETNENRIDIRLIEDNIPSSFY